MNAPRDNTPLSEDAIEEIAAAWLVEKGEGLTPAQAAEFARWRDADPRHARAIALLEQTCGILGKLPLARERVTENASPVGGDARERVENGAAGPLAHARSYGRAPRIVRFPLLKTAAALAACFALAFFLWNSQRTSFTQTYTTAAGGYQRFVLPDESVLELNASTEVRLQFSNGLRQLTLGQGEAHFTVARDAARPFIVAARGVAVRAVGTAFNVRLDQDAVDVLVTEGRVEISQPEAAARNPALTRQLAAGQRLVVTGAATPVIAAVDAAGIRAALAWQSPRLVFLDTPLAEVARQFNRHNRIQLIVEDEELGRRAVGGTFRADHVETFVALLEKSRDVAVERPDAERIVVRKVKP